MKAETISIQRLEQELARRDRASEALDALRALAPGQVGIRRFPVSDAHLLQEWRSALWGAANGLRNATDDRGLLCTAVRDDGGGHALYYWFSKDGATPPEEPPLASAPAVSARGHSVSEAAATLKVSEKTIRRYLKSGKLRAAMVNGPRGPEYRIPELAVAAAPPQALGRRSEALSADKRREAPPSSPMDTPLERELRAKVQVAVLRLDGFARRIAELERDNALLTATLARAEGSQAAATPSTPSVETAPRPWWRRVIGS